MTLAAGASFALMTAVAGFAGMRAQSAVRDGEPALLVFHQRVEAYAELHRALAPPPASATDPIGKLLTREYLASAIRAKRSATQGSIFTPEAAALIRELLANAIGEADGERFLTGLNGGVPVLRGLHPTVNETYTMSTLFRVPAEVTRALPPLPAELDYRIAGHDLVLWDIYAGIVVDFIPDALLPRVTT
jgi:hypothetical protein